MATSAATLSQIIDALVKAKCTDRASAITLLGAKGFLPKLLTEPAKVKKVSRFASKAAEDYADAHDVTIPEDFKGTGNNDKVTVKDIKSLAEGPKKTKANASPSALQYARDNGIDISLITKGNGTDGKILLSDIKALKPSKGSKPGSKTASDDDEKPAKISAQAAKLMKQYDIDEDDITDIDGTGVGGAILAKDLAEMIKMIKEDASEAEDEE